MNLSGTENDVQNKYPDYLRDESRRSGYADGISFPSSESELSNILKSLKGCVTVQGALTGITGGAVPQGGHILNLARMNSILGIHKSDSDETPFFMTVQPGVSLKAIKECLRSSHKDSFGDILDFPVFFPPDPTEDTASIGGMIACNSSGARSFKYGPTRPYVRRLKIMTVAGDVLELTRGREKADGLAFAIKTSQQDYTGIIPPYPLPDVKNASGYYSASGMDLIDLFIGSEGTLGIILEADILLAPLPAVNWAIMAFLPDINSAVAFVNACRALKDISIAAIEYFDDKALSLLRSQKENNPAFSYLPEIDSESHTCVYVELDGLSEPAVERTVVEISSLIDSNGGNESSTWMATEAQEMERMKKFRHALPEAVNLLIDSYRRKDPGITKLGTDFAVPDIYLGEIMDLYARDLAGTGLDYVIFGHIGNNHLHVNILPKTLDQYNSGKSLYMKWAGAVIKMNGTVSAEHGIGKLKTALLAEMYGVKGIQAMRDLKKIFDPESRLNPGNLFQLQAE